MTGGSSGLGLALAKALAKSGAHISIVARNTGRLKQALEELEVSVQRCARSLVPCEPFLPLQTVRQSPEQQFRSYSFAVNSEDGSAAAIKAASEPYGGRCPDAFFLCAGASRPGDRKSTRLNSSHSGESRMPSSA